MCSKENVRATAGDNTGQNTKDTHPVPGQEVKLLTPRELYPGRRVERQGLYQPRQGDGRSINLRDINLLINFNV